MTIKLLQFIFSKVIGDFSPEQKAVFQKKFNELLSEVIKAAAEGAVKGSTMPLLLL